MNSRLVPLIILNIIFDVYVYHSLSAVFSSGVSLWVFQVVYWLALILSYISFFKIDQKIKDRSLFHGAGINFYIGFLMSSLLTKLIFCVSTLIYDLGRLLYALSSLGDGFIMPSRVSVIVLGIICISALVFLVMIYGITRGKYHYKVERVDLSFADLPKSFDGLKIVHISDIHAGSYDNSRGLNLGVSLINNEQPDLILFTGDLVNDHKDEVIPFVEDLKRLQSKYGIYAVLGNHDYYGAYRQQDKDAYWQDFFTIYRRLGFNLLNNDNKTICIGKDQIKIVGSENWGIAGWTPKRGDLNKAFRSIETNDFCILLTHDPTHWDHQVLRFPKKVHLCLSGHTHGFQFGINLPFFKWSPAKYSYPKWMGLYQEQEQYLYVNRGFGFLAFPGRVGMRPEITAITLHCR